MASRWWAIWNIPVCSGQAIQEMFVDINVIISLSCAIISTVIAASVAALAFANYKLAKRRRKDELFDRRYKLYQEIRDLWLATGGDTPEEHQIDLDIDYIMPVAEEAGFLFGDDIVQHIYSLSGKRHKGLGFPNEDFIGPFTKYLKFEE